MFTIYCPADSPIPLPSPIPTGYNRGMDERPSWVFWIAGTAVMLFFIGSTSLPLILFIGGKPAFEVLFASTLLSFEYASEIVGVLASAGLILLIVRLTNRRRAAP